LGLSCFIYVFRQVNRFNYFYKILKGVPLRQLMPN